MWVGSATRSVLSVAPKVRLPTHLVHRGGKSSERTYCFNFKALRLVSEGASFWTSVPHLTINTHTRTLPQMSKQPVAVGKDASGVVKGIGLFLTGHSEPTGCGGSAPFTCDYLTIFTMRLSSSLYTMYQYLGTKDSI